jgi:hypothetical protein
VTSVLCYNNIFIPFIELLNKFCKFIGNGIITIETGIIYCESAIFKRFNYIDPIFTAIHGIESLFRKIDLDIGTPTTQLFELYFRVTQMSQIYMWDSTILV